MHRSNDRSRTLDRKLSNKMRFLYSEVSVSKGKVVRKQDFTESDIPQLNSNSTLSCEGETDEGRSIKKSSYQNRRPKRSTEVIHYT